MYNLIFFPYRVIMAYVRLPQTIRERRKMRRTLIDQPEWAEALI